MENNKRYREDSISGASGGRLKHFYKYLLRFQSNLTRDKTFLLGLKHPFFDREHRLWIPTRPP